MLSWTICINVYNDKGEFLRTEREYLNIPNIERLCKYAKELGYKGDDPSNSHAEIVMEEYSRHGIIRQLRITLEFGDDISATTMVQ